MLARAPETYQCCSSIHQPKNAGVPAARGVALQLSGHTRGGMIRGLDRLAVCANGGFVSGRYDLGGMTLYVSNGAALWPGFALRLGVPSELTQITLRARGQFERLQPWAPQDQLRMAAVWVVPLFALSACGPSAKRSNGKR